MDCEDVRLHLHDDQRGHLGPELHRELRTHLEGCPACAHEEAAEHMLTEVLERRLPQHPASLALKRRLLAQWPAAPVESRPWWMGVIWWEWFVSGGGPNDNTYSPRDKPAEKFLTAWYHRG